MTPYVLFFNAPGYANTADKTLGQWVIGAMASGDFYNDAYFDCNVVESTGYDTYDDAVAALRKRFETDALINNLGRTSE